MAKYLLALSQQLISSYLSNNKKKKIRAVSVEDKNSAVETVSREKATSDPGSVGAPMSGVVVEVRVKEGQEIKKGDPVCGMSFITLVSLGGSPSADYKCGIPVLSAMKVGLLIIFTSYPNSN